MEEEDKDSKIKRESKNSGSKKEDKDFEFKIEGGEEWWRFNPNQGEEELARLMAEAERTLDKEETNQDKRRFSLGATPKAVALGCYVFSGLSKTLETAETFYEVNETSGLNITVHAFAEDPVTSTVIDKLYNCGGFYSTSPLVMDQEPSISVTYVILTILAAIAFVLVIDSYWPML
jgi:hypothetical protein